MSYVQSKALRLPKRILGKNEQWLSQLSTTVENASNVVRACALRQTHDSLRLSNVDALGNGCVENMKCPV